MVRGRLLVVELAMLGAQSLDQWKDTSILVEMAEVVCPCWRLRIETGFVMLIEILLTLEMLIERLIARLFVKQGSGFA